MLGRSMSVRPPCLHFGESYGNFGVMSDFDSRDAKRPPEPTDNDNLFTDAKFISVFTRAQALADGVLVDVTETALEAGFTFPTAVTQALWEEIENVPEEVAGYETPEGRLWDVLFMASLAVRGSKREGSELVYPVILHTEETPGETEYRVKLVCGPGDEGEPVLTLMLPHED